VDPVELPGQVIPETLAEPRDPAALLRHLLEGDLARTPHTHAERDRKGPAAQPPFVPAAGEEGEDRDPRTATTDPEGAHPLRAVELVCGEGEKIDAKARDVDGDLSDRLRGVGVEQDPPFARERSDLGERLDDSDLVVRVHDRHEERPGVERRAKRTEVDEPPGVDGKSGDAEPLFLQGTARIEHRLVLRATHHDVIPALPVGAGDTEQRQVVRLGGTRREDDLARRRADQCGNAAARPIHPFLRPPPVCVGAAGGVAELLGEVGGHRLHDAPVARRGGLVIEIDRLRIRHLRGPQVAPRAKSPGGPGAIVHPE
jgi:hypothetical protein